MPGRHASGVNAGGVRQLARHVAEIPLSVPRWRSGTRIGDLVDDDCGFASHGQVLVAENEDELGELPRPRRRAAAARLPPRGADRRATSCAARAGRLRTCPGGIVSRRDGAAIPSARRRPSGARPRALGVADPRGRAASTEVVRRRHGIGASRPRRAISRRPHRQCRRRLGRPHRGRSSASRCRSRSIAPMLMITGACRPSSSRW